LRSRKFFIKWALIFGNKKDGRVRSEGFTRKMLSGKGFINYTVVFIKLSITKVVDTFKFT